MGPSMNTQKSLAASGRNGVVTAPHWLASEAGRDVLRDGGSAIEAMLAMAATIAVVYPHMNSIGGDNFWLIHAPGREPVAIDACGRSAQGVSISHYHERGVGAALPFRGPLAACTVAGAVSGWQVALDVAAAVGARTHLPLPRLLESAITFARNGMPVTASQQKATTQKQTELSSQPGFAAVFLPGGAPPAAGSLLKQTALATTLETLAKAGLSDFYVGDIAHAIASDLAAVGSPIRLRDLTDHAASRVQPLRLEHARGQLYNLPPPTQGLVSLVMLGLMQRHDVKRLSPHGSDFVHLAVECTKRAFLLRDEYITDPAFMVVNAQNFLDGERLDKLAKSIDMKNAMPWPPRDAGEKYGKGPSDTVWMGAIDARGVAVSMIQSIYHEFGSGIVLPQTGITWQNRGVSFSMNPKALNPLTPGRKPFHTLNPALAELGDGRTLVYGNMGGDGQPQSQSAVFTRVVDFAMPPAEAIAAPRWLLGRAWGNTSESLKLESRFGSALAADLSGRGHNVEVLGDFDEMMGHAGVVVRRPDGTTEGASDPRSDGAALAA